MANYNLPVPIDLIAITPSFVPAFEHHKSDPHDERDKYKNYKYLDRSSEKTYEGDYRLQKRDQQRDQHKDPAPFSSSFHPNRHN